MEGICVGVGVFGYALANCMGYVRGCGSSFSGFGSRSGVGRGVSVGGGLV